LDDGDNDDDDKLCNVLFTRELQRRLSLDEKTKNIVVNCFNPGLIVSTGLFRDQNQVFTKVRMTSSRSPLLSLIIINHLGAMLRFVCGQL
jgi:hypothetical protein